MIALVQKKKAHGTSISFDTLPTVGNKIIVGVAIWNTAIGTGDITDNQGNTYTRDVTRSPGASKANVALFSAPVGTSAGTFTISWGGASAPTLFIFEYSGIAASSAFDQSNTHDDTTTAVSAGAVTTTTDGELYIALTSNDNGTDDGIKFDASGGPGKQIEDLNGSSSQNGCVSAMVANQGTYTPAWTLDGTQNSFSCVATYKPTSAGLVTIKNLLSGKSSADATSYATASGNFVAGRLYLIAFSSRTGITANPNQPTASGAGITWVVPTNGSVVFDTTSSSRRRLTVFYGLCTADQAGAITIDEGGQTQTAATWTIEEVTGHNTTTPVVQAANNQSQSNVTSLTATLAAFANANNPTFGAFGDPGSIVPVAGSGFYDVGAARDRTENSVSVNTEFKPTNDTTVDWSFATALEIGCIGVEINAASVVAATAKQLSALGVG